MKTQRKLFSLLLVFAMIVTSLPGDLAVSKAAGKEGETGKTALLKWDSSYISEDDGDELTEDGTEWTKKTEFSSVEQRVDGLYVSTYSLKYSEDEILEALGLDSSEVGSVEPNYSYHWYKITDKDTDNEEDEEIGDSSELYIYDNISNESDVTTYRCVVKMDSVDTYWGGTYELGDLDSDQYTFQVTKDFVYNYTGPSEEKIESGDIDLSDYFQVDEDSLEDETINMEVGSYNDISLPAMAISSEDYQNRMDVTWTRKYADGTEEEVEDWKQTNTRNIWSQEIYSNIYDDKLVDAYVCTVNLKYGSRVLKTYNKTYTIRSSVFWVNEPASSVTKVYSRMNAKKTFKINAQYSSNYCKRLTYQWYSVDKEGKETKLADETADTLKKKITDFSLSYKCVISAVMRPGYTELEDTKEYAFQVEKVPGLLVKSVSSPSQYAGLGEPVELSVDASTDAGYKLSYSWYQLQTNNYGSTKRVEIGEDSPSLTVKAEKESDFGAVSDPSAGYESYRYGLIMSVKDDEDKEIMNRVYHFTLYENMGITYTSNQTSEYSDPIQVYYGDSAELYVKNTSKDNYKVEKTWYKEIAAQAFRRVISSGTANEKIEYLDPEFKEPAEVDYYYDGPYQYNEIYDEYVSVRHFMKKVTDGVSEDGAVCTVSGTGNIPGVYVCQVSVYSGSESQNLRDSRTFNFNVDQKSDLTAYAKNSTVKVVKGDKAELEVAASNFDSVKCPITYKWEKYDEDKEVYETITGAEAAKYTLDAVKKEDFGKYRAVVSDAVGTKTVYITLEEEEKVIVYSPSYAEYAASVGDTVKLNVDVALPKDIKPIYAWYRSVSDYREAQDGSEVSTDYWELINEDNSEYSVNVKGDDEYRQYKCILSYKQDNTYENREFRFLIVRNEFSVEPMTPRVQYKQFGSRATYSVRAVAADKAVTDDKFTYEWYRQLDGEKIEGANQNTYTIDKLAEKDFDSLTCRVSMGSNSKTVTFNTYMEVNAYLDMEYDAQEVSLGDNVTMEPKILDGDGYSFTYQWYRGDIEYSYGDDDEDEYEEEYEEMRIIHGATDKTYTIKSLGQNEIDKVYYCKVFVNGANVFTYQVRLSEKAQEKGIELKAKDGSTSLSVVLGKSAKMAVEAKSLTGLGLKYQWYYDTTAIGGATSDTYTLDKVIQDNYGMYRCVVTDSDGHRESITFYLRQTTDLHVKYDTLWADAVSYETKIGGEVSLKANAQIDPSYQIYYDWFKVERTKTAKRILGEESDTLKLSNIKEEDLCNYYCRVYDAAGLNEYYVYFRVYVDTGLKIVPNCEEVMIQGDGSAKMAVAASANPGEKISYQWYKKEIKEDDYDEDEDEYEDEYERATWGERVEIENATSDSYEIKPVKKADYGEYYCQVSTRGEDYEYHFSLFPAYRISADREYAEQGGDVSVTVNVENPASDITYTYEWYVQDPITDSMVRTDQTTAAFSTKAPKVIITQNGYKNIKYTCVIKDGEETLTTISDSVRVLPVIDYSSTKLPETEHPNNKAYDVQAYQIPGAEKIKIQFAPETDLGEASLYLINKEGQVVSYYYYEEEDETDGRSVYVNGDSVILLLTNNTKGGYYGYKVNSITKVEKPVPTEAPQASKAPQASGAPQATAAAAAAASASGSKDTASAKKLPKKGTKKTVSNVVYKVTKSAAKNGTAAVVSVKSKKLKSVTIAKSVKINGYTFKVTAIANNAFKGCSKLKKITVKSTTLKSVGKAFQQVPKKAKAKVPSSKKSAYKKLFKKAGFKGKVK